MRVCWWFLSRQTIPSRSLLGWLNLWRCNFLCCSGSWCISPRCVIYSAPAGGCWTRLLWADFPTGSTMDQSSSLIPSVLARLSGTRSPLRFHIFPCHQHWHVFLLLHPYLCLNHLLLLNFGLDILCRCGQSCHSSSISNFSLCLLRRSCMSYTYLFYFRRWQTTPPLSCLQILLEDFMTSCSLQGGCMYPSHQQGSRHYPWWSRFATPPTSFRIFLGRLRKAMQLQGISFLRISPLIAFLGLLG